MDAKEYDKQEFPQADLKLIILGDSAVGKSKLVERFLLNDYEERRLSTYALTMYRHKTVLDNNTINVDVWDTAGQDCFQKLHISYYYGSHVAIFVFDITRKITYQNLKNWYNEMREHTPHIPCICIANKIDIDKSVTEKKFKFGEDNNMPFYFVSAADGTNVVKIFNEALRLALDYKKNPHVDDFENELMEFLDEI